jgi:phage portal protein BeeE
VEQGAARQQRPPGWRAGLQQWPDDDGGAVRAAEIRAGRDVYGCQKRRPADASREGGLDRKAMSLSPRDIHLIAPKQMAAREIALALGVPPMPLGMLA